MNLNKQILWRSEEVEASTGIVSNGRWDATGISIDSRTMSSGDLFVAIKGPTFDGHNFIGEAINRGAAGIMISRLSKGVPDSFPRLIVDNTEDGLRKLGMASRARSKAQIIAVTGSVGKTSVKEALGLVLSKQGKVSSTLGSLNNHLGVPLSLARMPINTSYGIFELGMNHAGEITELARMVKPSIAIITNVEPAHLKHFESVEAIAEAKAEIFSGMKKGGVAILNMDNSYFDILSKVASSSELNVLSFGENRDAVFKLNKCCLEDDGSRVEAIIDGSKIIYRIGAPGYHWVINSLAILAVAHLTGGDIAQAANSFEKLSPLKGRGLKNRVIANGFDFLLIDDSYNASPASISAALSVLSNIDKGNGRRIAVLGDMLELGDNSPLFHTSILQEINKSGIDLVFAVGAHMRSLFSVLPSKKRAFWALKAEDILGSISSEVKQDDVILVKGSFGMNMKLIVDDLLKLAAQNGERR